MSIKQGDIFLYSNHIYVVKKVKNVRVHLVRCADRLTSVVLPAAYYRMEVEEYFVKLTI